MTTTINNEHKKLNAPNLRFPEFQGEWEKCTLGDVSEFSKERVNTQNLSYDNYVTTENMLQNYQGVIAASNVPANTNVIKFNEGNVLLSNIRPYLKKVWFADKNGGCSADVFVFKAFPVCIPDFLHHIIANDRFINFAMSGAKGVKMPRGDKDQMRTYEIGLPSIEEQKKIAKLLSLLDERIATQSKVIEDLKSQQKFWIDRIFCLSKSSGRNYILLSKIAKKVTRRNKDNEVGTVLSNTANQGIIAQDNIFGREIANEENTNNYYVIEKGNFVYNPRKSANAPYGPVNKYDGNEKGIISPLYLCFSVSNINADYLQWYFKSNAWYKYVYQKGDSGVRHDRVSIKDDVFLAMPLYVHTDKEQTEIVEFLNLLQKKIDIEEGLKELYANQKVYLLRQMFI